MQGGTNSSEFRIPDSELDGSVELRIPSPQASRLIPVPSDKILLPRRMLYVEAVLYVTVALTAFGLGYLAGRRGWSAASKEDALLVEGKVLLVPRTGDKRGNEGTIVIVLPSDKLPARRLPLDDLQLGNPPQTTRNAASAALAELGGAVDWTDASGHFALGIPAAGSYRILLIAPREKGLPVSPLVNPDISELGKYFDEPSNLLHRYCCGWMTKDLHLGAAAITAEFKESSE